MLKIKLLIVFFILCSCSVYTPYLYKREIYTVIETHKFFCVASGKYKTIRIRNFDLQVGDTLYSFEQIPVINFCENRSDRVVVNIDSSRKNIHYITTNTCGFDTIRIKTDSLLLPIGTKLMLKDEFNLCTPY